MPGHVPFKSYASVILLKLLNKSRVGIQLKLSLRERKGDADDEEEGFVALIKLNTIQMSCVVKRQTGKEGKEVTE